MALPRRIPLNLIKPGALGETFIDPVERLAELSQLRALHPGRIPGGTGTTGLAPGDRRGFDALLEEQREFENLQNFLNDPEGFEPVQVSGGGEFGPRPGRSFTGSSLPEPHEDFVRRTQRDIDARMAGIRRASGRI